MRLGHDVVVPKEAKPDRYVVDRTGTPDPSDTEYWVLDLVHDIDARVVLAKLGSLYRMRGKEQLAKECFDQLHATQAAHQAHVEKMNPKTKKSTKRENVPA